MWPASETCAAACKAVAFLPWSPCPNDVLTQCTVCLAAQALESNTTVKLRDLSGCQVGLMHGCQLMNTQQQGRPHSACLTSCEWCCSYLQHPALLVTSMQLTEFWSQSSRLIAEHVIDATGQEIDATVHDYITCLLAVGWLQVSAGTCVVLAETLSSNTALDAVILEVSHPLGIMIKGKPLQGPCPGGVPAA